jgi:hypothetical protein
MTRDPAADPAPQPRIDPAAEQRNREHGPLDLDQVLICIREAKDYVNEEVDPEAWLAAALQNAEDMAAELQKARELLAELLMQ